MRIGNIEISDKRFRGITFKSAKKACEILGDGWRLPTEIEMAGLSGFLDYLGDDKRIGQFGDYKNPNDLMYWTNERSVIDLKGGGIYLTDHHEVIEVSSIMVRDI
jgi:hypothetical protein